MNCGECWWFCFGANNISISGHRPICSFLVLWERYLSSSVFLRNDESPRWNSPQNVKLFVVTSWWLCVKDPLFHFIIPELLLFTHKFQCHSATGEERSSHLCYPSRNSSSVWVLVLIGQLGFLAFFPQNKQNHLLLLLLKSERKD